MEVEDRAQPQSINVIEISELEFALDTFRKALISNDTTKIAQVLEKHVSFMNFVTSRQQLFQQMIEFWKFFLLSTLWKHLNYSLTLS